MHEHGTHNDPTITRYTDVAIVGGSVAGLAAALQLSRQRRSVIVVDAGEPRNAPAEHMHSFLGYEGRPPSDLTNVGRGEVRSYGSEVLSGRVSQVTQMEDGDFQLLLVGGHVISARRVLIATGLVDVFPGIEGLDAHWGTDVIHCPFCHGYEVRDQTIVHIVTHPMHLHTVSLFHQLTDDLTVILHDGLDLQSDGVSALQAAGIPVLNQRVQAVNAGTNGRVESVQLADGSTLPAQAIAIGTTFRVDVAPFASLGLTAVEHASGLGATFTTSPMGATTVDGVYAAGNVVDPGQQVLQAAANGSQVGGMIAADLAGVDLGTSKQANLNQVDWDERYSGDNMWSGEPNSSLVALMDGVTPGRALDVGAGEGGDAVWLAEQGWVVTASDVSGVGLNKVAQVATERGLHVATLQTDANAVDAYPTAAFDLVTAHYASIPRTPDNRAVHNLMSAVAVGGALLVVSHDLELMRAPIDTSAMSRGFDPDAYVRVEDVAIALSASTGWEIVMYETVPRSGHHASPSHMVNDVVLQAKRIGEQEMRQS